MIKQKVVAAIDFGTHGSGYAWAVISEQNKDPHTRQIKVRTQWPSQPVSAAKNLTALLLGVPDHLEAWGYEAKRIASTRRTDLRYIDGFKMQLTGSIVGSDTGRPNSLPVSRLIELYLHQLYELAIADISMSGYRPEEIRWCLTVPAIWDDYQKQVMWRAAVAAGLPDDEKRLVLAIEPEAAAHYARVAGVRTLGATSGRRASLSSPGSRFIVADCGGGTVDITAYRTDTGGKLVEIGRDFGGSHGSEYLNKAFVNAAARKLGGFDALAELAAARATAFMDCIANWERAKLTVSMDPTDDVYISIPTALDRMMSDDVRSKLADEQDGIDDHLILKPSDQIEIFEAVIPSILDLVDRQLEEVQRVSRRPTGEIVILVGGFGASPYLQASLAEHLDGRAEMLLPPEPGVAVLYGATHFAYDPQTRARRAKYTYGCALAWPFREGRDPQSKLRINDRGERMCTHPFTVFVESGQTVAVDQSVTQSCYPFNTNDREVMIEFFRTRRKDPVYTDEPGSSRIGQLTVDLSGIIDIAHNEKEIIITLFLGDTKMRAYARLAKTGQTIDAELEFDATG